MMKKYPLVSIIIPTLNEEKNIGKCLTSVFGQDYPYQKLEVFVVDDDSSDRTIEIAKNFPIKLMRNGEKHGERGKMVGFKAAKGEFAMYLDADIELVSKDFFQKMLKPLLEDENIIGSFTNEGSNKNSPPLIRYLSFDTLQRDSVYQFFSPSIDKTIITEKDGYYLCEFKEGNIPPAGRCLYRREQLLKLVSQYHMFMELDFLVLCARNDFNYFAYVPKAKLYHHHAPTLKVLLHKRRYNLLKVYPLHVHFNLYTWFDTSKITDLIKIAVWIIYANLIIPSIIVGVYKSIKHKDWVGMYEPLVNFLITDTIILTSLMSKERLMLFMRRKDAR